jgi:hypothetical protein
VSFVFGSLDTSALGVTATLKSWPTFPGLSTDTLSMPGADGAFYAGSAYGMGRFEFDLLARAATPADMHALVGRLAQGLDPALGLLPLTPETAEGWAWRAVVSSGIDWKRKLWQSGDECQLAASLAFVCPDPYGYALVDEVWQRTGAGSQTITRQKGDVASLPLIEVRGVLAAGQTVTVTLGGKAVRVSGPLASGQVLRLDYKQDVFAVWDGAAKVANIDASRINTFDQVKLPMGASTFAVATTGTVSQVNVWAQSRRI